MNAHLNEEQLYGLLDDANSPSDLGAEKHLLACAPCRSELETLDHSLTNFRVAATNLSSLYTPSLLLDRESVRPRFFTIPRTAWAAGLVTAMVLCTASISIMHRPVSPAHPTTQTNSAVSSAQSDDALLNGIDTDLSTSVPPSLQPLDVNAASEKTSNLTSN